MLKHKFGCMNRTLLAVLVGTVVFGIATGMAQSTPDIIWEITGHDNEVYSITFNTDGTSVLSGGGETARIWETETGTPLHTFGPHPADLVSVAISRDDAMVAAGWVTASYPQGGLMRLWDVPSESAVRDHGGAHVAFSPDGSLVAAAGGGFNRYVRLYLVDSGVDRGSIYCGPGYITSLAFSPDRQHLAVGSTDNTIKVWDYHNLTQILELSGFIEDVSAVAYSPDGALLAGAEGGFDIDDDSWIRLFSTVDGAPAGAWEAHGQTTYALVFAPGGTVIASSGRDGSAPLRHSIRYWNTADGLLVHEYDELALSLDISPNGTRICYGGLYGRVVVAAEDLLVTTPVPTPDLAGFILHAPRPNPFNPLTTIAFSLGLSEWAEVSIYELSGRRVTVLAARDFKAGSHALTWNGCDAQGRDMPSGTYVVRLETTSGVQTRKVALVK